MFVNVFGGITACDAVANGIVKALQILGGRANKPWWSAWTATTSTKVAGSCRGQPPAGDPAETMDAGADKPPNSPNKPEGTNMSIF